MKLSYDHNHSLGYLTGLASRLFNNLIARRFREAGIDLTAEQWGVVMLLSKGEATTQKQLSEQLYLEKSSVSRLLDGLEKKGWLERQPDPEDSRRKRVIPTERALAEASRCSAIANAVLSDVQQGIAADDLEQGQSVLNQVIGNLRDLNG
ncbi:MAG: MarR family transcriptional regulator [Oceanospirillaceae bacterium]|uniref:MarR family winged helix-turn-helix transcriptional regulator n=1 Tax=unclassified Thalassolituus TaxID=2624967 RepID=UPI000C5462B1|nr:MULTISPECIES: MarR family transcriptional regulator [unclassified Thalassolituus]MAS24239.1 MarR family transcriptional regulator [Oceanospirillaceae bacterium]MAX99982.1 MarR family transcriptional regulator [Oceanospirillaceae bacterium]MBL36169.1 MarR family transcriptional regulator [Oceanospirillaceae bacterium]MBS53059.1 MarR family transcriptional regulator [Oceanospirillaceae bacterium]|tara:strand:- start:704 stop:1153 length:450 start_codon:yes stop_codon:yes gene_type:complete